MDVDERDVIQGVSVKCAPLTHSFTSFFLFCFCTDKRLCTFFSQLDTHLHLARTVEYVPQKAGLYVGGRTHGERCAADAVVQTNSCKDGGNDYLGAFRDAFRWKACEKEPEEGHRIESGSDSKRSGSHLMGSS